MQVECSDILAQLETWYARENGLYLQEAAGRQLQGILDTSFGYHLLQLGVHGARPLYAASPISHTLYCAGVAGERVNLVADPDELPLDSDSVDTVILHHALEFVASPHQVLREVQRVLTPQGHLLVVGFNPYSLLGAATRLRGLLRRGLWRQHRPLGDRRLTDWLHLLGFEVGEIRHLYAVPPVGRGRLRRWLTGVDTWMARHNVPCGGVYILHATKQVVALHQVRRHRRTRQGRLIGLVPKPIPTPTPAPITPARKVILFPRKSS